MRRLAATLLFTVFIHHIACSERPSCIHDFSCDKEQKFLSLSGEYLGWCADCKQRAESCQILKAQLLKSKVILQEGHTAVPEGVITPGRSRGLKIQWNDVLQVKQCSRQHTTGEVWTMVYQKEDTGPPKAGLMRRLLTKIKKGLLPDKFYVASKAYDPKKISPLPKNPEALFSVNQIEYYVGQNSFGRVPDLLAQSVKGRVNLANINVCAFVVCPPQSLLQDAQDLIVAASAEAMMQEMNKRPPPPPHTPAVEPPPPTKLPALPAPPLESAISAPSDGDEDLAAQERLMGINHHKGREHYEQQPFFGAQPPPYAEGAPPPYDANGYRDLPPPYQASPSYQPSPFYQAPPTYPPPSYPLSSHLSPFPYAYADGGLQPPSYTPSYKTYYPVGAARYPNYAQT